MRYTRYYKVKGDTSKATHLKFEVFYDLGGVNYFTYKNEARGYYMSICPVTRENRFGCVTESFTMFSGSKMLISEVKRQSNKAYNAAKIDAIEKFDTIREMWFPNIEIENEYVEKEG